MSAHPNALGLMDRAKRLIDESTPPDQSPLTTASRDIREARTAVAELIESAGCRAEWVNGSWYAVNASGHALSNVARSEAGALNEVAENLAAALANVNGDK